MIPFGTPNQGATKTISFVTHDTSQNTNPPKQMLLNIRPEELTRTDTSRLAVMQTFGGAWADSFGKGVPSIKIAGQTGWRTNAQGIDGLAFFQKLFDTVYTQWHTKRADLSKQGKNPDAINLIFSDLVDNINWVCAPMSFTLKRGIQNPLLCHYEINLVWLKDYVLPPALPGPTGLLTDILNSMNLAMRKIQNFMTAVKDDINGFFAPIKTFVGGVMAVAYGVASFVQGALSSANGVITTLTSDVMGVASGLALATHLGLASIMAVTSFPGQAKSEIMGAAASFMNLACIFNNGLKPTRLLTNYDSLFGASLCSSTAGGMPINGYYGLNSFEQILPLNANGTSSMNQSAVSALSQMTKIDPVFQPLSLSQVNALSMQISDGTRI